MTECKHTPGPWRLSISKNAIFADDRCIAFISPACGIIETEADANVYLMAASPKMFKALKETLVTLICVDVVLENVSAYNKETREMVISAIKEACEAMNMVEVNES